VSNSARSRVVSSIGYAQMHVRLAVQCDRIRVISVLIWTRRVDISFGYDRSTAVDFGEHVVVLSVSAPSHRYDSS